MYDVANLQTAVDMLTLDQMKQLTENLFFFDCSAQKNIIYHKLYYLTKNIKMGKSNQLVGVQ